MSTHTPLLGAVLRVGESRRRHREPRPIGDASGRDGDVGGSTLPGGGGRSRWLGQPGVTNCDRRVGPSPHLHLVLEGTSSCAMRGGALDDTEYQ